MGGHEISKEKMWETIEKYMWLPWLSMEELSSERSMPIIVRGDGIYLEDIEGRRYIDGAAGVVCVNLGYGNKEVLEALEKQIEELHFTFYKSAFSLSSIRLCEKLAQILHKDLNHVYLGITGSDAVEAAMMMARQYFRGQGKTNNTIISRWYSFHGLSLGALAATSIPERKPSIGMYNINLGAQYVFPPYCYRCLYKLEYPKCEVHCARVIKEVIKLTGPDNVAGFIGEPTLGNFGGVVPPDEYWPIVREICDDYKIPLIFDEIMSGFGRTGKLFAYEHWNVIPDIITLAKGINSAYAPLSAAVANDRIFNGSGKLCHSNTHSFSAVGSASALAAIEVLLKNKMWEHAAEMGKHLMNRLMEIAENSKVIGQVHGMGLLDGIEIVRDKKTKEPFPAEYPFVHKLWKRCLENGLFLLERGQVGLGFTPPLIITKGQIDEMCEIFAQALRETEAEVK